MRMKYQGTTAIDDKEVLYNCTRNVSCQKEYFIPIPNIGELLLYFDLSEVGKPLFYSITVYDCLGNESYQLSFNNFVMAQTPGEEWYGVFTWVDDAYKNLVLNRFYVKGVFVDKDNKEHYFYSPEMEYPQCGKLTRIEGCYNDSSRGSLTWDVNGTYYGYHAGSGTAVGNPGLRYYHYVYVRDCKVLPSKTKMTGYLFNNRSFYGNDITNLYTLQFELVPDFYKKEIMAVLSRGNITVDGEMWTMDSSQDFSVSDTDSGLWKLDAVLNEFIRQRFSCKPTVCKVAPPPCLGNYTGVALSKDAAGLMTLTWSGGSVGADSVITYRILQNGTVFRTGTLTGNILNLNAVYNPYWCYTVEWTLHCDFGGVDTQTKTFCCTITSSGSFPAGVCGVPYDNYVTLSGADSFVISQVKTAIPGFIVQIVNGNRVRLFGTYIMGDCPVVRSLDFTVNDCMNFHHAVTFNAPPVVVIPKVTAVKAMQPGLFGDPAYVEITLDSFPGSTVKLFVYVTATWPDGSIYQIPVQVSIAGVSKTGRTEFMMNSEHHLMGRCIYKVEGGEIDYSDFNC